MLVIGIDATVIIDRCSAGRKLDHGQLTLILISKNIKNISEYDSLHVFKDFFVSMDSDLR